MSLISKKINEFEEKFGNFDGDKNYGLVAVIKDFLLQSLTEVIEETIKECIGVSDKLWGNFDKSYPEEYPERKETGFDVGFKDGYQYATDDMEQRITSLLTGLTKKA